MKVLFIYSLEDIQSIVKPLRSWESIQFGVSYLSSMLKTHGHKTHLVVLGSNYLKDSLRIVRSAIDEFSPELVCFTAVSSQYPFIEKVASFVKSNWSKKMIMLGGVHATLNPEEVDINVFDAICIGEGEYPIVEFCSQLEKGSAPRKIANLWIKLQDGTVEKNPVRQFIHDLDSLPFPDRLMWTPWMKEKLGDDIAVLIGRGCPYSCTYCSNAALKKIASGKYVRMRSCDNIIKEIALVNEMYPENKKIYLEVESIAFNMAWVLELCKKLTVFNSSVGNSLFYGCNFRITKHSVNEELFAELKRANFSKVNIGLESGSERIRKEILKRDYSNEEFLKVVAMARRQGLKVYVFNIIGLPSETFKEYMETVSLNRQCQPDDHFTGIFFPYPGTEIYDICVEKCLLINSVSARLERKQAVIDLPDFSKRQIQSAYIWFNYRVYKGYRPLWKILIRVVIVKLRSSPRSNLIFRKTVQLPVIRHIRAKLAEMA